MGTAVVGGCLEEAALKRIILGLAVVLGGSGCTSVDIDDRATELVGRLGPMCGHLDFQTKQTVGEGEVRPVFCSEVDDETDHPHFTLYVFSDEEAKDAWLQLPRRGAPIAHASGDVWTVESDDPGVADEVKGRLEGSG